MPQPGGAQCGFTGFRVRGLRSSAQGLELRAWP